jgi:glycosyltransferase involved in cell wall biosynthesis
MLQPVPCKLSICISTFNRAAFIGATLESIIEQITNDCEIVVLDGGSTDDTERVVAEYVCRCDRLRYLRQDTNNGVDRDYDCAVRVARGEYCWLASDDDLLKPGAVSAVLSSLNQDLSLILINAETMNINMSSIVQGRFLNIDSDRSYSPSEMDRMFAETGDILQYIGCVVIKRIIWLERDRERYFGSLFIHVGVIFQKPLPGRATVIAKPLISYRMGNTRTFSAKSFEVCMFNWPSVVWSLSLSESAKNKVSRAEPWRAFQSLLQFRAMGYYSSTEYNCWIRPRLRSMWESLTPKVVALLPGTLANSLLLLYYSVAGHNRHMWLQALKESRFYVLKWGVFERSALGNSK